MYTNAPVGNTKAQYVQDDTELSPDVIQSDVTQYLCSQSQAFNSWKDVYSTT